MFWPSPVANIQTGVARDYGRCECIVEANGYEIGRDTSSMAHPASHGWDYIELKLSTVKLPQELGGRVRLPLIAWLAHDLLESLLRDSSRVDFAADKGDQLRRTLPCR